MPVPHSRLTALVACAGVWLATSPAGAQQIDSAYSTIDWEDGCMVLAESGPDEHAWAQLGCPGYGDYPVFISDDDARMSLDYGFVVGPGGWESFVGFNTVHDTVEWRLQMTADGWTPFATIHRWFVDDGEGGERQVLVVSTVAPPEGGESCMVGFVDASAQTNANVLAREVADNVARGFTCGTDEPQYYGATGELTPDVTY